MSKIEYIIDELTHRAKLLPGVRQVHTRIVKAYVPDDDAPEKFKDGLFDFKYNTTK